MTVCGLREIINDMRRMIPDQKVESTVDAADGMPTVHEVRARYPTAQKNTQPLPEPVPNSAPRVGSQGAQKSYRVVTPNASVSGWLGEQNREGW